MSLLALRVRRPGVVSRWRSRTASGIPLAAWYAAGSPPNGTVAARQAIARRRYDAFMSYCLTQAGMPTGMPAGAYRIAAPNQGFYPDTARLNTTVSEGIGYGMLLCAWMGNPNLPDGIRVTNAQAIFNGLWTYYKHFRNENGLMHWHIWEDGTMALAGADVPGGASDGDFDVAMALVIAHRQWGSGGTVNYGADATTLINAIRDFEFTPTTYTGVGGPNVMMNGDKWGIDSDRYMPDYFRPGFFREFARHTGDTRWNDIIAKNYPIALGHFWTNFTGGVVPDGSTRASLANGVENYTAGYNAVRWWGIAADYLWNGTGANTLAHDMSNRMVTKGKTHWSTGGAVKAPAYDLNLDGPFQTFGNGAGWSMFGLSALVSSTHSAWAGEVLAAIDADTEQSYFNMGLSAIAAMFMAGIAQPSARLVPSGNPFANTTFYLNPESAAKKDADLYRTPYPDVAAQFDKIANAPVAIWAGDWIPLGTEAAWISARLAPAGQLPVFVLYNIPVRDNGGYSGGGATSADAYRTWITNIISGLGSRQAVLIYEPDALGHLNSLSATHRAERVTLMKETIARLANAGHFVYTDSGHSNWHPASTWANMLVEVGAGAGRGIALNVSNFRLTSEIETFGNDVITASGLPLTMVIDTSRNGNGPEPNGDVFNPPGRALGRLPSVGTGKVDAYFYIKAPGESDGDDGVAVDGPIIPPCAGDWYRNYAYGLAYRAAFGVTAGPTPPPPQIWYKTSTLKSDFSSLKACVFPGSFGATIVSGRVDIVPTTSYPRASTGTGADTVKYSLLDSHVHVEVPTVTPAGNGTISTTLQVEVPGPAGGMNSLEVLKQGTSLIARQLVGGVGYAADVAVTYDATAHRWWRIRHAAGVVYWETSPDKVTWTIIRQGAPDAGLDLSAAAVALVAGFYGTEPTVSSAQFDNLNL